MQWIANPQNRAFESHPVFQCPSSPIGMRRFSQKENRPGSSPGRGTNQGSMAEHGLRQQS